VSVVFAALMGWLWLREGFGARRTLGAICIFAGILVIALLG
jgi:drug/metabolite transporter (DMT)-like permease